METLAAIAAAKRAQVLRMAKVGMLEYQIAFSLSVSIATLRLFYGDAMQEAEITVNLEILEALQRLARSGKSATATTFWARTRCGFGANHKTPNPLIPNSYSEPDTLIVVGPNGERSSRQ
jgi:hypothetical protein